MKLTKIIATALLLGIVSFAQAQQAGPANAIDKYFQQYVEDERFTVVYISSKLLNMFGKLDVDMDMDDKETAAIMELASDLEGIRILVAEENASGFYKEAKGKINTKEYEVLMTVRNKGEENVDFLIKDDGDKTITELLLLVGGGDEFVLMSFTGIIDLDKVSKLINEFEDEGDDDDAGNSQKQ